MILVSRGVYKYWQVWMHTNSHGSTRILFLNVYDMKMDILLHAPYFTPAVTGESFFFINIFNAWCFDSSLLCYPGVNTTACSYEATNSKQRDTTNTFNTLCLWITPNITRNMQFACHKRISYATAFLQCSCLTTDPWLQPTRRCLHHCRDAVPTEHF
jgi:hypothetical protein